MKSCYLKLRNGQIEISSSPYFTIKEIEELIRKNEAEILTYLATYEPHYLFQDKGYVYMFGKKYQLVLKDLGVAKVVNHGDQLYVYQCNIEKLMMDYLRKELRSYLVARIDYYLIDLFSLPQPRIEIKKTKWRWGACYPKRNLVIFNLSLVHLRPQLIDYIIVHELCHFFQASHSPAFYREVARRLPDYKQLERELRKESI